MGSIRWLVTGAGGQLGRALHLTLAGEQATFLTRGELDITDPAAHALLLVGHGMVVVNTAAWTDVDAAETDPAGAYATNAWGAYLLARRCREVGALLLHVSTDHVFGADPDRATPYREGDPPYPVNMYGHTKRWGEQLILAELPHRGYVVRTAWLYGPGSGFPRRILDQAGPPYLARVQVANDQFGSPTSTLDLTARLVDLGHAALGGTAPPGLYHGVNDGYASKHELAVATLRLAGLDPDLLLHPCRTAHLPGLSGPAPRPTYSVLGQARWKRAGLPPMRPWQDALAETLNS